MVRLIDGLMDAGYDCVHLANPSAMTQYEGIKHTDDQHDAFFLLRCLFWTFYRKAAFILKKTGRRVIWHESAEQ